MLREALFQADAFAKEQQEDYILPVAHMNEDAFRIFYLEVAPALQGYIRKSCGNAELAEDILQEAFCRFLRINLPKMDPPQQKAYVYKIATSLMIDHWRREKRENFWKRLWRPAEATRDVSKDKDDVTRALSKMKPAERALLWLAYVEGFDHAEIASAMGLKEKSIRVLLFRARKNMTRILGGQPGNYGAIS
jgi:RNA polymerase sigma-70 factor, ECF subfamily